MSLSFLYRYYLLLKAYYFLSYSTFASFGPILNITLRTRGLSDSEISYINLVIPFLCFFTNPLVGYFADHTRRFRLVFNITLGLGTILFLIMFFLPLIKTYHIQGELHQTETTAYSLRFCANKQFATKCSLRTRCGCTYQANCTSATMKLNHSERSILTKWHQFNFTMNSTFIEKEQLAGNNTRSVCDIRYHVPIDQSIEIQTNDRLRGNALAACEIKCSVDHLCHGSRYSHQITFVLLYAFLIVIGVNLFSNATTIGTSLGFAILVDRSNLFGRQRLWGTIGYGMTAFVASRLYARFPTEYVYIGLLIASTTLTILLTSFVRIGSKKSPQSSTEESDTFVTQKGNDRSVNANTDNTDEKNHLSKIRALLPTFKKIDVMVFFCTTFVWGISHGALDPYLSLYIDEISPCDSHSIIGYMSLITASVEVVALLVAHKLLKRLGTRVSTILIFIAFVIRFTGYYFIRKPYFLLPIETTHFFNFGILYVLIAQEAVAIAPPGLSGTLQGFVYGVSFGLGRGVGLLVSLFIYTRMTKRSLFLIYAIINLVCMIIYSVYCLLSKRQSASPTTPDKQSDQSSKRNTSESERNFNQEPLISLST